MIKGYGTNYSQDGLPPSGGNVATTTTSSTAYTLGTADAQTLISFSSSSAIAVTIPKNSSVPLPVGTQVSVLQTSGQITIAGASGVTVVSTGATASSPKTRVAYSIATFVQMSADNWLVTGDVV